MTRSARILRLLDKDDEITFGVEYNCSDDDYVLLAMVAHDSVEETIRIFARSVTNGKEFPITIACPFLMDDQDVVYFLKQEFCAFLNRDDF